MLTDRDDFRHPLADRPHTRESIFYNLHLPEEGLSGFFYTWVDPHDRVGRVVTLYGDNGERLLFDHRDDLSGAGQDFEDWEAGGLTIRHTKALEVAEIAYRGQDAAVDMTFTGLHRAFSYTENENGCPRWLADDRFEQSGAVQGRLQVGGRQIDFDTTAHRDHSWGTRDWASVHHWKWISGQAGPYVTFNAMYTLALGRRWVNGYVNRSGKVWPITDIEVESEFDDQFGQTKVGVRLTSADGNTTEAAVERFSILPFAPGGGIVMHEAGCRGEAGGRDALVHVEMGWPEYYVAHQVSLARA
jgi:hypothetical protein